MINSPKKHHTSHASPTTVSRKTSFEVPLAPSDGRRCFTSHNLQDPSSSSPPPPPPLPPQALPPGNEYVIANLSRHSSSSSRRQRFEQSVSSEQALGLGARRRMMVMMMVVMMMMIGEDSTLSHEIMGVRVRETFELNQLKSAPS
jgi:hypothetical protein